MEDNKEGLLMLKVNGEIVYFNAQEIDRLLSETVTNKEILENESSDLQQKVQICGGFGKR